MISRHRLYVIYLKALPEKIYETITSNHHIESFNNLDLKVKPTK